MGSLVLNGATSGSTTLTPTDAVTATLTLPSATTTLAGLTTPSFTTTIGVGGATASASGSGVSFPATQSASSDANTLDDYEEGTFTPTLGAASSDPTGVSYNVQQGYYTKVGNMVTIQLYLSWTSYTGGSGSIVVRGLPFAASSSQPQYLGTAVDYNFIFSSSYLFLSTNLPNAVTYCTPVQINNATGNAGIALSTNPSGTRRDIQIFGSYRTTT